MNKSNTSTRVKALNRDQILEVAEELADSLKGIRQNDAVAALSASIYIIALGQNPPDDIRMKTSPSFNPNLCRFRKAGKIEDDHEIMAYIHGIDRHLTIQELQEELVDKFGGNRAPSRSGIGRYLQKIGMSCQKKTPG